MTAKNRIPSVTTNSDEFNLGKILGTLLDNAWLIVGVTTLCTVLGIGYVILAEPVYRADSLVQVEQSAGNSLINDISQMLPDSQPMSATEIEIIQSRMILNKTIDDLGLDTVIEQKYFPIFGNGISRLSKEIPGVISISKLSVPDSLMDEKFVLKVEEENKFSVEYDGDKLLSGVVGQLATGSGVTLLVNDILAKPGTEFYVIKRTKIKVLNDLLDCLNIYDKGKDTGILSLVLTGKNKETVIKTLNSISNNYLEQNVERKSAEAAKSLVFLNEQLPAIRASLDVSENKLNQYRQKNDSVDLSLEAKSVLDTLVAVDAQLNELTFKEAEISKLYTKEHPAYRALLEKRITLESEKAKLSKKVSSMPKTQQEILRLTRDVQSGQAIYMQLLNKQQELSISKASTVGNVRIIDKASAQPEPVRPQKALIIIASLFFGGFISIGFVMINSMLHKGINTPEELEALGINVYASIPMSEWQQKRDRVLTQSKRTSRNTRSIDLLAIGNPTDLAIEAIRSLRTSLHFAMLESKCNSLMISGTSPSIGKTFVSLNLAAVIAQAGQRVLVIDSDMRKGYAHELLGVDGNDGLSDILAEKVTLNNAIKHTSIGGFDFIPRGQIPPNPSELLMRESFSELIREAQELYDLILIDTPPILAVTDSAIIGRVVGTSLLVARFDVTSIKEVEVSIRRFEQNGVDIKGVIINSVLKKASSYYNYGYNYYQYSYDSNESKKK